MTAELRSSSPKLAPEAGPDVPQRGLLLFAHGARDPNWARPFQAVAEQVRLGDPSCRVELAFLEFMSPDLLEAGAGLVQAGCTAVDVVPLFLGAGGHVRKDLPMLMGQLRERHPSLSWVLHRAVGEEPLVIQAMASAALLRAVTVQGEAAAEAPNATGAGG